MELTKKLYALREQAQSLAQECLLVDRTDAFQSLNKIIVDITNLVRSLPDGNVGNDLVSREDKGGKEKFPSLESPLEVFRNFKGQRYEATLDPGRIQPDGRGKCIRSQGRWMSVSDAATQITGTAVNGWVNFWRFRDNEGIEHNIDLIRKEILSD